MSTLLKHGEAYLARYRDFQDNLIGPNPLADGAHDWPAWSDLPNTLSPRRPLTGWRYWAVVVTTDGARLVAPIATGATWSPGINRATATRCGSHGRHPMPSTGKNPCQCGIRIVQSLTVLRAFVANPHVARGPLVAFAECNVWGRVAPFVPDDDWQYTLRAEFAEIAGPLHLAPTHAEHAEALAEHYGIEVQLDQTSTEGEPPC